MFISLLIAATLQSSMPAGAMAALPLDVAITTVHGSGQRHVAVVADPYCPYCASIERELEFAGDVTVHTFLVGVLTPNSAPMARAIWCAPDRVRALDLWFRMRRAPAPARPDCEAPLERAAALAQRLQLRATPLIIFEDGAIVQGALRPEQLARHLGRQTLGVR